MGCWGSDGHEREKMELLCVGFYLTNLEGVLIEFCDKPKVDQQKFKRAVESAVDFLEVVGADYIPKKRPSRPFSPCWKDQDGNQCPVYYEHMDVFGRVVEESPNPSKTVADIRRKLLSLINRRLNKASKKKNAEKCIEFLSRLSQKFLYEVDWYEPRTPKGLKKLLKKL